MMPEHERGLPRPNTVAGRILWVYVVPIVLIHMLALVAVVPWLFSWTGVAVMVLGVHVFGQGINIGYHRLLTHRSFDAPRWVERGFVLLALCCLQDTPARWVANHRHHHKHSDTQPDPHSPLVNFLWSHVGWLALRNEGIHTLSSYQASVPDIIRDPFYRRLEKQPVLVFWAYAAHALLYLVIGAAAGAALAAQGTDRGVAALQSGLSLLVWGVFVRTVVVWHITWSVNSLSHMFGYRNYETGEESRNNWLVALLTVGEGWHNNHHHDPASASNQHRWWELDVSYCEIRLLERIGLARRVLPPRHLRQRTLAADAAGASAA